MKRVVLVLCLAASMGSAARADGLLKTLVCYRPFYGPYYGCHGGCDPTCMSGCMAGPYGCGARYWGDFWDPPPECCEPCDGVGNWIGRGPCPPRRPLLHFLFGGPLACGGCGHCGECCGDYDCGGCGSCDSCAGGYSEGGYVDEGYGGYSGGGRPGCSSCGGGGGHMSEPVYHEGPGSMQPTPAAPPPSSSGRNYYGPNRRLGQGGPAVARHVAPNSTRSLPARTVSRELPAGGPTAPSRSRVTQVEWQDQARSVPRYPRPAPTRR